MAHVGTHFGDAARLNDEFLRTVREKDMMYLDAVAAGDKKRLLDVVMSDMDATKICGFPTMYTMLDVLERTGGGCEFKLLSYEQAVDFENDRCVTFAGGAFYSDMHP